VKRQKNAVARTANESGFTAILSRLVHLVPGCHAAAFVDQEGEAVDVAGFGDEYEVKVAGAYANVLVHDAVALGPVKRLIFSGKGRSYVIHALPEGYILVLVMAPTAAFHVSERALDLASHALSREAGFDAPARRVRWFPVDILPRGAKVARPTRARTKDTWRDVQVLGSVVGLAKGERGYRVRLENGAEITLVREPIGRWWADDEID